MAIFNGRFTPDDDDEVNEPLLLRGYLLPVSKITLTNDMEDMTLPTGGGSQNLPIYNDCYNNGVEYLIEDLLSSITDTINNVLIPELNKSMLIDLCLDNYHLNNEPENITIKNGEIKGVEKVLYIEKIGR